MRQIEMLKLPREIRQKLLELGAIKWEQTMCNTKDTRDEYIMSQMTREQVRTILRSMRVKPGKELLVVAIRVGEIKMLARLLLPNPPEGTADCFCQLCKEFDVDV